MVLRHHAFDPSIAVVLRLGRIGLGTALVAQLPAELAEPLFRIGPVSVTNVELTAYLLATVWLAAVVHGDVKLPRLGRPVALALLVALLVGVVATVAALYSAETSAKALLRLGGAAVCGAALAQVVLGDGAFRPIAVAGLIAATATAAMGLFEHGLSVSASESLFEPFREAPIVLPGGLVRATATLIHANVAGWFWGLAAVVALSGLPSTSGWRSAVLFAAAVALATGLALSFSRGALLGTAAASLFAAYLLRDRGHPRWQAALPALATPLALVLGLALSPIYLPRVVNETVMLRASIASPAELTTTTLPLDIDVTVRNEGFVPLTNSGPGQVQLSYHVYGPDGALRLFDGTRTALPATVPPGAETRVSARIDKLPSSGTLRIAWDLVQEQIGWFSLATPAAPLSFPSTLVHADVNTLPPTAPTLQPPPALRPEVPRSLLWSAAVDMFLARPLTGIGLDNFRLGLGHWLGLSDWDSRVNANNLYLEILATAGAIGLAALLAIGWLALVGAVRGAMSSSRAGPYLIAVVVLVSTATHGLVDAFLLFSTATYAVGAAVAIGLAGAEESRRVSRRRDR